ncbi:hypothetical protein [Pelosinus sp. UFO1]|uniref:hypothetical protein n=1 Tax=Pelosinus sp. UFO1 TaxID=484770 RepID=UPI0004D0B6D3|nr:hypothetical protein [Pelosinus sp. UFO1]AIF52793.1 hypothetical protein UFO1_3250 [Pelosinus sp. UFO1]
MKTGETVLVLLLMGVMIVVGNTIGYHYPITDAMIGYLMIMAVTLIGMGLAKIMPIKLPMVFWISLIALLATSPISPYAGLITAYTNKVDFLALITPILAYAGLSVGKDLVMFKKMSWRIVIVALTVYTGTFVCATAVAQLMLKLEGII